MAAGTYWGLGCCRIQLRARAAALAATALRPCPCLEPCEEREPRWLFWTWHHGTVTSPPRTSHHVALTLSQQRLRSRPGAGRVAPGAAFSQTQALAGDQLALHPPCAPCQGEEGLEKPRQTQISTKPCLLRALCPAPRPTSSPWGSAPCAPLCWILRCDHPHPRRSPCACWRPGRGKPRRSGASNLHYFGSHGAAWASWPFGSPT